jgi:hypothetical protein
MSINKGGRGKKSPYQTVTIRVPMPIKDAVDYIADEFRSNNRVPITPCQSWVWVSPEDKAAFDAFTPDQDHLDWIDENLWQIEALNESYDKVPVMPSRDEAIEKALEILKSKKSARQSLAKLIDYIYSHSDPTVL